MKEETKMKCQWPGCSEKAELYLKGRPEGEHLCVRHTTQVVNSPECRAMTEADAELAELLEQGGKLN
jgi:hypothetical protein